MKKLIYLLVSLMIISIIVINCMPSFALANAKDNLIVEEKEKFKVFVGCLENMNNVEKKLIKEDRKSLIKKITSDKNSINVLISFNKFTDADELNSILDKYSSEIVINSIWFSIPGKDGRAMKKVENNDIQKSITAFFTEAKIDNKDNELLELEEKYGIFAIELNCNSNITEKLMSENIINHIDTYYYPEVEKLALENEKYVSYISLPEKPDGTG